MLLSCDPAIPLWRTYPKDILTKIWKREQYVQCHLCCNIWIVKTGKKTNVHKYDTSVGWINTV